MSVAGCATPREADSVTLARSAKEAIGVSSIDEISVSNVQKLPTAEGPLSLGKSQYRFFVDTVRGKKFVCDATLAGRGMTGKQLSNDVVKCTER